MTKIEEDIRSLKTCISLLENTKYDYKPDYGKYYRDFFKNEPMMTTINDKPNLETIFGIGEDE